MELLIVFYCFYSWNRENCFKKAA